MPKLIEFMNDVQRDSRLNEILFPSYGEKRCMEIITRYEKNEELVKKSESFLDLIGLIPSRATFLGSGFLFLQLFGQPKPAIVGVFSISQATFPPCLA